MTATARRELVSPATRNAFRSLATDMTVRIVADLWQDHGFAPVPDEDLKYDDSSVRRTTYQSYAQGVDWADYDHVSRALLVFEDFIRFCKRAGWEGTWLEDIEVRLERDGFVLDGRGRISWRRRPPVVMDRKLSELTDPSGIMIELERIRRDLTTDPAGAIGASKQLIESTAKAVLREFGVDPGKADIPALVNTVQKHLKLDAASAQPGPDGSNGVKRILSGVVGVAVGVAEVRNAYGSGHGQASAPKGLSERHARLAVNAAVTWCELILDTLADPAAPWRKGQAGA